MSDEATTRTKAPEDSKEFKEWVREQKGEETASTAETREAKAEDLSSMRGGNPEATPTPASPLPGAESEPLPGSAGGQADKVTSHNPPSSADNNAGWDLKAKAEAEGGPVVARGVVKIEDQPGGLLADEDMSDEDLAERQKAQESGGPLPTASGQSAESAAKAAEAKPEPEPKASASKASTSK